MGTEPITVTRWRIMDDALHMRHDFINRPFSAQCRFRDVSFIGV
jgi:hypothetical protein